VNVVLSRNPTQLAAPPQPPGGGIGAETAAALVAAPAFDAATESAAAAAASRVRSFAPLAAAGARVLVLGSMPGVASLAAGEYYAHRRNAFWPIMATLFGFAADAAYAQRVAALAAAGVALWDVLAACERVGSLDAAIVRGSESANDIAGLLAQQPRIVRLAFNGAAAEAAFRRHVRPRLPAARLAGLDCVCLPSTSPANASWSYAEKLAAWRAGVTPAFSVNAPCRRRHAAR